MGGWNEPLLLPDPTISYTQPRLIITISELDLNMDKFFRPGQTYVVGGASSNPSKFGYKVLKWYVDRGLPVAALNPRKESILGLQSVENIKEILESADGEIGVSLVTPPAVSKEIIQTISADDRNKVQSIWFQPGTYDREVLDLARQTVPNIIEDCILVNGDRFLSKL